MKRSFISSALIVLTITALFHSSPASLSGVGGYDADSPTRGNETAVNQSEWKLVRTIDDTSEYSTAYPNNKRTMVWWGEEVFHAYVINEKNGGSRSVISYSNDSGNNWSSPITVFNSSVSNYVMVEIMVHNGELFYVNLERYGSDVLDRHVFAKVVNITEWQKLNTATAVRIDDDKKGAVGNTVLVGLEDRVILFCQRSHYTDIYYRIYQNGTWAPIRFINENGESSWPAPVVMNVSGVETLFIFYTYYHDNVLAVVSSTDGGLSWSEARTIFPSIPEALSRLAVENYNGKLHLVAEQRFDTGVYYANSRNGVMWTPLKKIGTMGYTEASSEYVDLVIEADEENDMMFVAFDNKTQIEVLSSDNNGSSFDQHFTFKNTSAKNPTFCSRGKFLLYNDDSDSLYIRKFVIPGIHDPDIEEPDDKNTSEQNNTDDDDHNGNNTSPQNNTDDDNYNGDDTSTQNNTNDDDHSGNNTSPQNNTDDDDQSGTEWENTKPSNVKFSLVEGTLQVGSKIVLFATSFDPDILTSGDIITYHWYVNDKFFDEGTNITIWILEAGLYKISLIAFDSRDEARGVEKTIFFSDPIPESSGNGFSSFIFIFSLIIMIILAASSIFILKKKKTNGGYHDPDDKIDILLKETLEDNVQIRSGRLPTSVDRPGCSYVNTVAFPQTYSKPTIGVHEPFEVRSKTKMLDNAQRSIPRTSKQYDADLLLKKATNMLRSDEISENAYNEIKKILLERKEMT
jgi:hypothetical protein